MRLAQWQESFIDALRQGGDDEALLALVDPAQASRLAVYRNNSLQALTARLSIAFPICQELVGETCFSRLAVDYIHTHPMVESNLNSYGEAFPRFLLGIIARGPEFDKVRYLAEVARLEWSLQLSYYAADSRDCQQLAQMANLSEDQQQDVVLGLRPDIFILESSFPLYEIWLVHQHEPSAIDCSDAEYFLSVSRDSFKPQVNPLSEQDFKLLDAIACGESLGEMMHRGLDMASLPQWIARGWVCGFILRGAR
ncbi:HvfC/BufC family peptide modification chaperone [Shewanella violacea]|uniref:Putative DNA-binding domain-containing protein n=1 Tax=Shewanella violacea (strain JCM 10179 / CIP 106290 / LMG 19151 / DSS12) TaxID=637905 RepID=D4ZF37_SHEVD|nr:putative DNA-binding domain-containing protein [Shewanella violacea]BAJ04201.1 hypothetical protein SVI_4230 [Shewanella violacea DSS12]